MGRSEGQKPSPNILRECARPRAQFGGMEIDLTFEVSESRDLTSPLM